MTKTTLLAAALLGATAACAVGTASHDGSSKKADDLTICFYDGGPCVDADVPDPSAIFEAGAPSAPSIPDAGAPPFGFCGFDAKYPTEYFAAVSSASIKPCFAGCASTECCYAGLACVAE